MKIRHGVGLLLPILLMLSCDPKNYFREKYFKDSYLPKEHILTGETIPHSHLIPNVHHISYANAYCNSASLEMLNETLQKQDTSIHYYNWLMGFSYGAFYRGNVYSFIPYTDPEPDMAFACPYLGLQRNYYTCEDSTLYIKHLKEIISNDMPVRIAINSAIIRSKNKKQFWPHSVVLTGYDKDQFRFYETGYTDRDTLGSPGEMLPQSVLLEAVRDMGVRFGYPWTYNFTTFEASKNSENQDQRQVWLRNGKQLVGDKIPMTPIWTGSSAVKALATTILNDSLSARQSKVLAIWIETAEYSRNDNADFMLQSFTSDTIRASANYLKKASTNYELALSLLKEETSVPQIDEIARLLMECSELEKKAGELMITYAER